MNQLQRDLTYRLEAVQSVCDQNGEESQACKDVVQLFESQHNMNMFSSSVFLYGELIALTFSVFIFGCFLYFQFIKSKAEKENKK